MTDISPEIRLAELSARLSELTHVEVTEWHALQQALLPRAVPSFYDLADPASIPLYAGTLLVPSSRPAGVPAAVAGEIAFSLTRPRIVVRGKTDAGLADLDALLGEPPQPQLPKMSGVPTPPQKQSIIHDTGWIGPAGGYVAGAAVTVKEVTFLLVNFPTVYGATIGDGVNGWPGRITAVAGPWTVTIDARQSLDEILERAGEGAGYAVTHTCRLARRDGRRFSFDSAHRALECLTWCLWLCRGAAASPILPVGFDLDHQAVWSRWSAPQIDPLPDGHWQWFDSAYGGQQFASLFPLFFTRWSDPVWRSTLLIAVRYYTDAAAQGTLQRNLILAQVGLESLAFRLLISSGALTPKQFGPPVANHIRSLLTDLDIPTTIPSHFRALRAINANSPWDGPAAIVWLRNDVVHANRRNVGPRRWRLSYQGLQLSIWYLELSILAICGYSDVYRNRLKHEAIRSAVEPVPW